MRHLKLKILWTLCIYTTYLLFNTSIITYYAKIFLSNFSFK